MQSTVWSDRPTPQNAILIFAFEGWNDAGDAATGATRYLANRCEAEQIGTIGSEDFCDFASSRPRVSLDDKGQREIEWPDYTISIGRLAGNERDLVFLEGSEPRLHWQQFCSEVVDVARDVDAEMVISLGALLADVLHDEPTPVYANSGCPGIQKKHDLEPSLYEGPTGIVGVLGQATQDAGFPTASLWVPVPSYAPGSPSPKATLALVHHALMLTQQNTPLTDLEIASSDYERLVNSLVDDDEEIQEYIRSVHEHRASFEIEPSGDELVAEVEKFLQNQDPSEE